MLQPCTGPKPRLTSPCQFRERYFVILNNILTQGHFVTSKVFHIQSSDLHMLGKGSPHRSRNIARRSGDHIILRNECDGVKQQEFTYVTEVFFNPIFPGIQEHVNRYYLLNMRLTQAFTLFKSNTIYKTRVKQLSAAATTPPILFIV